MKRAILKPGRAKPFWYGHPWVFSEAIASLEGDPAPGDILDLCDERGRAIARGFYNPRSQIRLRLIARPHEEINAAFWKKSLSRAVSLRRDLLQLPNSQTDAFRLVNSEGDGLSGLTIDRFGDVLVVQITSLGLRNHAEEIYDALEDLLAPRAILEAAAPNPQSLEGFSVSPGLRRGSLPEAPLIIRENGIRYRLDLISGQKTGFYCDQRENRKRVESLARDRRVLDAFSFTGGFALSCLKGGAKEVTLLDASERALSLAEANLELNGFSGRLVQGDALRFLEICQERFDLIILDPPKFAQKTRDKPQALKGYRRLNALGLGLLAPDGILVTCSCSGLVSEEEFLRALGEAAYDAGRSLEVLSVSFAGPDHPIRLPCVEGRYLKCVIARAL